MAGADKEDFRQAVYQMVRHIPYGRATSYGVIARAVGYPGRSRLVGHVLGHIPDALSDLPAHRVVNSQGVLSGKDAFATPTAMEELLKAEGVEVAGNRIKNWKSVFWDPMHEIDDP